MCADTSSIDTEPVGYWPGPFRRGLLRTIGIDIRHLRTARSALPYLVAGFAMCFYLPYGTWAISHALGLANGGSGRVAWWMVIGAFCVTGVIIGFDALIISYVAVNTKDLDDPEAPPIGKLSKAMIALRLVIAVVMVGVFTIPTLLFFFQRETTADLAAQNQAAIASYIAHGPPAQLQAQINQLTGQESSDPNSVLALENKASTLDQESASDYQLALKDSQGQGVTHLTGCPVGGTCWALEQKSQQEEAEAKSLRQQAASLQAGQKSQLSSDAAQVATLTQRRNSDIQSFSEAQSNNTGLGERTKSLVSLIGRDPYGIGLAAAIILAVATLLELAVLGIKITASRNSEYELSVAREARRAMKTESELDSAADAIAGEAMASVRIDADLRDEVFRNRRSQLQRMLLARMGPAAPPTTPEGRVPAEPPEQPGTPIDEPATSPVEQLSLTDPLDHRPVEKPTLGVQPAPTVVERSGPVVPYRVGSSTQPSPLRAQVDAGAVTAPTTPADPTVPRSVATRASLGLPPLMTARMPGWSNAGRVTAVVVMLGVGLAVLIWGFG